MFYGNAVIPIFFNGTKVKITYRNAAGEESQRVVTVFNNYSVGKVRYLTGYCSLRNEVRTFRYDRIRSYSVYSESNTAPPPSPSFIPEKQKAVGEVPSGRSNWIGGTEKSRDGCGFFGRIIWIAVFSLIIYAVKPDLFHPNKSDSSYPYYYSDSVQSIIESLEEDTSIPPGTKAETQKTDPVHRAAASGSKVVTVVRRIHYRGRTIEEVQSGQEWYYRIQKEEHNRFKDIQITKEHINTVEFSAITGMSDKVLIDFYQRADKDGNTELSWDELQTFQNSIVYRFKYLPNDTALSPDKFLSAGGGDCEDWSLFTCGLLEYWNWDSYLGIIESPDGSESHGITLVYRETKPDTLGYFQIAQEETISYNIKKPGYYIPVDYRSIGKLSNAVGEDWLLSGIEKPELTYGREL